jgi:hypothetical protein
MTTKFSICIYACPEMLCYILLKSCPLCFCNVSEINESCNAAILLLLDHDDGLQLYYCCWIMVTVNWEFTEMVNSQEVHGIFLLMVYFSSSIIWWYYISIYIGSFNGMDPIFAKKSDIVVMTHHDTPWFPTRRCLNCLVVHMSARRRERRSGVPCAHMHARPGNVLLLLAAIRGLKSCMDFWWRPTPQPSASYMEVPAAAATCNRHQLKRNTLYILDLHARTKILGNLSAVPNSTHMCLWSNDN